MYTTSSQKKIKMLLLERDVSQAKIARRLRVSPTAVSNTIRGNSESKRIKKAIAKAVGRRVEELWPSKTADH